MEDVLYEVGKRGGFAFQGRPGSDRLQLKAVDGLEEGGADPSPVERMAHAGHFLVAGRIMDEGVEGEEAEWDPECQEWNRAVTEMTDHGRSRSWIVAGRSRLVNPPLSSNGAGKARPHFK